MIVASYDGKGGRVTTVASLSNESKDRASGYMVQTSFKRYNMFQPTFNRIICV